MIDKLKEWAPGLALCGVMLAGFILAMTPTATAIFVLPYTGPDVGALVFVPQFTFHLALWVLGLVFFGFVLIVCDRLFGAILPLTTRTFFLLLAAGTAVVLLLFALARFDYWALYPDRLVVQRPWGQSVYTLNEVLSVSVGCHLKQGRRGRRENVIYALSVNGRQFDIARERSMVLGGGLESSVRAIEYLQPRLIGQGTAYYRSATAPECVRKGALALDGDGLQRLWSIGVRAQ